jgi:soluble lytic murein transglycosylase
VALLVWAQSLPGQLEGLARALREEGTDAAYAKLEAYARANQGKEPGAQAALALGRADFDKKRFDAAARWFQQAEGSAVLREYALYQGALTARAAWREAQAVELLDKLRKEFPSSVLGEAAVRQFAEAALLSGQAQRALDALQAQEPAPNSASFLLLRARAQQQTKRDEAAAADYAAVYDRFPLSNEAKTAAAVLPGLEKSLGAKFPRATTERKVARAEALFGANRCREAQAEFTALLRELQGAEREKAELRIARCRVRAGAPTSVLAALKVQDPEVEAERLYALSQAYRSRRQEAKMLEAIELTAKRFPKSVWAEEALQAGGHYYWVELERAEAARFYARVAQLYPTGKNGVNAHWRVAWTAYLERPGEAGGRLEEHIRKFPASPYVENALYWLGRLAERGGDLPRARAFYAKGAERFTQSYYGRQAAARLQAIGVGRTTPAEVLALIPAAGPTPALDDTIPARAEPYRQRAQALLMLGYELEAEQELRSAYAQTGARRLLLEAAQAAHQASRHGVGIAVARRLDPYLDTRSLPEAPEEVWRAVYPLPYEESIAKNAERFGVDPMIVAGLIRQESTFLPDAVSRAGAVGLMQVLPRTGRTLARRAKVPYARSKLFDPDYNLRLGTSHLADLVNGYGNVEKALAAYNAGEHRVRAWTAQGEYREPAEFVESIPFTETREYVQIVMRNAEIYRRLYGETKQAGGGQ